MMMNAAAALLMATLYWVAVYACRITRAHTLLPPPPLPPPPRLPPLHGVGSLQQLTARQRLVNATARLALAAVRGLLSAAGD